MPSKYFVIIFAFLTGCSSIPYGEFDGQRVKFTDPDVYDVIIVASDGNAYFDDRKTMQLKPGYHLLQLASSKQGARGEVAYQAFPLNVKPCTRYSFVAKHEERFKITEWILTPTGEMLLPKCTVSATTQNQP